VQIFVYFQFLLKADLPPDLYGLFKAPFFFGAVHPPALHLLTAEFLSVLA